MNGELGCLFVQEDRRKPEPVLSLSKDSLQGSLIPIHRDSNPQNIPMEGGWEIPRMEQIHQRKPDPMVAGWVLTK